jgi:hypothetical protein
VTSCGREETLKIKVYGRTYPIRVIRRVTAPTESPRLVVVAFQPNETAREILRLCLESIRRYTPEEHELWVVDNASPMENAQWLEKEPAVNVIFNQSKPAPRINLFRKLFGSGEAPYLGSYANAVALELAAQVINPDTKLMMTLHMDTMPCQTGWLGYLIGHLDENVRCVGVRLDTARMKAVHVLGMLFDFSLFRKLSITFAHDMPKHDTGDNISLSFVRAGFSIWACSNSLWEPELLEGLPADSPYRNIRVDRSFDDKGRVIFLHLGRGIFKSYGDVTTDKTSPDQWIRFGKEIVLGG